MNTSRYNLKNFDIYSQEEQFEGISRHDLNQLHECSQNSNHSQDVDLDKVSPEINQFYDYKSHNVGRLTNGKTNGQSRKLKTINNQQEQQQLLIQEQKHLQVKVQAKSKQENESFINPEQMVRIGKTAVSIFCNEEKSKDFFSNYIKDLGLDPSKTKFSYENMISGILVDTYQKLFDFLGSCHRQINDLKQIHGEQKISNVLVNCKFHFSKQVCRILYDIMQSQWDLKVLEVNQNHAIKLHKALEQRLNYFSIKKQDNPSQTDGNIENSSSFGQQKNLGSQYRNTNKSNNSSKQFKSIRKNGQQTTTQPVSRVGKPKDINKLVNQLQKMKQNCYLWNNGFEQRLITLYKQNKPLKHISEYLIGNYPQYHSLFTTVALRAKIIRILRTSIYNFQRLRQKHEKKLPQYRKMNQLELRAIIYNQDAQQIRAILIQMYNSIKFNAVVITDIIFAIKSYLSRLKKDVRSNSLKTSIDFESYIREDEKTYNYRQQE